MNTSFQKCVADICGLELATLFGSFKYTVYGNSVAVVEGHGGIAEYSITKIAFVCGKRLLSVYGENLKIKNLEKHCAVVNGNISGVSLSDGGAR